MRDADPYTGAWTVTVTDGGLHVHHDGDPDMLADWLRQAISNTQACEGVRRKAAGRPVTPRGDVDPIVAELRRVREDRGVSLATVGQAMMLSASNVGGWERGAHRPRIDAVRAWAFVLGHDVTLTDRGRP